MLIAKPRQAMLTICAPDAEFLPGSSDNELRYDAVTWDGRGTPPTGAADVSFLIAGYADTTFDPAGLVALPRLEVVQLFSAGYEDWIPSLPPGVALANGRGIHGASTAELAVAGVLALVRGLPFYVGEQASHRWTPERRGEIAGRRALVLGAGDIGTRVAQVLDVLGAEAVRVGRNARDGIRGINALDSLLPSAEIVVLALPHTPDTDLLVNDQFLAALPDGAILANVARGRIVDTDALVGHLRRGRISAFLDVVDPEPLPPQHPIWDLPNVLITPHVGGGTNHWRERGAELVHEQLRRYVQGLPLINIVRPGSAAEDKTANTAPGVVFGQP
jgi:phosphoglycerate dehydrogenase-like enzyme